ncbi:MAG: leucine--tRNA ligase [Patescibacteria group bacterium]
MAKFFYDHRLVEQKCLKYWDELSLFQNSNLDLSSSEQAKKSYLLFAFVYPSGSGLHVGHVESKTALDILARYQRMNGQLVYFPVGWDAFGLPAENYAIKTGIHPNQTTKSAIDTFRQQTKRLAISYDFSSEISTSHPQYYRWTQWLFLQLYKKGLAYQEKGRVNWCPSCQTVLANEQVVNGLCERCESEVVQKDLKQWYFKIKDYQDELISGLDDLDWPAATKQQQLNWIGRHEGINITYPVYAFERGDGGEPGAKPSAESITELTCFSSRPDTNFGATFVVLAPEHAFAQEIAKEKKQVAEYLAKAEKKTELERQQEGRKKSGVFTGYYAFNRLTRLKMPIWVADFVLANFGTGAVVGVPAHDKRDFEFVDFVNRQQPQDPLKVIRVVAGPDGNQEAITQLEQVYEGEGELLNSQFLDGLMVKEAIEKMMDYLEEKGYGQRVVNYQLRDWLISRQRYWGTPIPIVYDPEGKAHPVKEEHLPWTLPEDVGFKPSGESPLKSSREFNERVERLYGEGWKPEYDTMDTFVDSSWYFLRYCDSRNQESFASPKRLEQWLPVDLYLIGREHVVLHLLYSRFFTKFLRDQGYLKISEPFAKMRHQGMILGPDGRKMSKSKGNVINPDKIVDQYGADTLRIYEMFMGPLETDKPWDDRAVAGVARFLRKFYRLAVEEIELVAQLWSVGDRADLVQKLQQTVKKLTEDLPKLKFNTAIAALMELSNLWGKASLLRKTANEPYLLLTAQELLILLGILAPLAPFMSEELYGQTKYAWQNIADQTLGEIRCELAEARARRQALESLEFAPSIHLTTWPAYDPALAQSEQITLAVQVNGKVRGELSVDRDLINDQAELLARAKALPALEKWLAGQKIVKEIYVPGKIISLVLAS